MLERTLASAETVRRRAQEFQRKEVAPLKIGLAPSISVSLILDPIAEIAKSAGPLSVTRLPHRDAVPQPLVHAFAVAARYRGERRFKVLFQQRQTRRPGQVNRPRQIETLPVSILLASFQ
jgi:hypothetical protein